MIKPAFSEGFSDQLRLGKYTDWAANLSEGELADVKALIETLATNSRDVLAVLEERQKAHDRMLGSLSRTRVALEFIRRAVLYGERFDMDEARSKIRQGMYWVGHPTFSDDPSLQPDSVANNCWASAKLSESHWGGLLWMVGELGMRAEGLLDFLDYHTETIMLREQREGSISGCLIRMKAAIKDLPRRLYEMGRPRNADRA